MAGFLGGLAALGDVVGGAEKVYSQQQQARQQRAAAQQQLDQAQRQKQVEAYLGQYFAGQGGGQPQAGPQPGQPQPPMGGPQPQGSGPAGLGMMQPQPPSPPVTSMPLPPPGQPQPQSGAGGPPGGMMAAIQPQGQGGTGGPSPAAYGGMTPQQKAGFIGRLNAVPPSGAPQGGGAMPPGGAGGQSALPSPIVQTPSGPAIVPQPQAPNFGQQLRAFAQNIKRNNPNADPAAIGQAVMTYAKLVNGDNAQQVKLMGLQMQQQGQFERLSMNLQERMSALQANLANRTSNVIIQQGGADQRNANTVAGADQRSASNISARAAAAAATGAGLDDETKTIIAQAMHAGDFALLQSTLGFSKNRPQLVSEVLKKFQELYPGTTGDQIAGFQAAFGGQKAAASTVGRTAGSVAVGAAEIPQIMPLAIQASQKLNLTQYPTVNSIEQAWFKHAGTPEEQANLTQLHQYIQTLKNAYQQVAARGGRMTDSMRRQADALMNGNMPTSVLIAAGQAMGKEAGIVKGAAGQAMKDVTSPAGTAPAAQSAPSSDAPTATDAQGNKVMWDGSAWKPVPRQ